MLSVGRHRLHLPIADIGDDAVAPFVYADSVRRAAEFSEKSGTSVFFDSGASAPGVGGVKTTVIQRHNSFRTQKTIAGSLYAADVNFHAIIGRVSGTQNSVCRKPG
jgi:hypothetical protein